jgi:hypothetical protein
VPALQSARGTGKTGLSTTRNALDGTANTPIFYIAITAKTTTTITGLPAATITAASLPSGPYYLGYYNGSAWVTIDGPATVLSSSSLSFSAVTFNPSILIAAGGTAYFCVYAGSSLPSPAPSASGLPSPSASAAPSPSPSPTPSQSPSPSPSPFPPLTASVTTIALDEAPENASFTVTEPGYTGTYTVTTTSSAAVSITTPITATPNTTTIPISSVAAGTATVKVEDSYGQSVSVVVTVTTTPVTIQGHAKGKGN